MSLPCQPGHTVHGQSKHTKARHAVNVQRYLWAETATVRSGSKSQCTVHVQQGTGWEEGTCSKQEVKACHLMEKNSTHTFMCKLRERLAAVQVIKLSEIGRTENA